MKRRILLVDPLAIERAYSEFMFEHLGDAFDICVCSSGLECLANISIFDPDFVYISMHLSDVDPLGLIFEIRTILGQTPIIIGTDVEKTLYIRQLTSLNVVRVLIEPYGLEEIGRQLCEIATYAYPKDDDYIIEALDYILLRLGFKCCGAKYECIKHAVLMKIENPQILAIKELYPALAEIVNGTNESVEKGFRDAIRTARVKRNEGIWRAMFSRLDNREVPLPTDEFICRMVLAVRYSERPRLSMEEFLSEKSSIINRA